MLDYKYYLIRFLQKVIEFSNFLQKFFIKSKKIILKGNEKILLLKLDRIGDAVWTVHIVFQLKQNFPDIKIDVLCNKYNEFVFQEHKHLFEKIYSLDVKPPVYLIKEFPKSLLSIFDSLKFFNKKLKYWKQLKHNNYSYVYNLTGRKYFMVSKYIGKEIGGGLGILNFLYKYPLIGHNEIGSDIHIVEKYLSIFENIKIVDNKISNKTKKINKILLFVGGKDIQKIDNFIKISVILKKLGYEVKTLSDNVNEKADYMLVKKQKGFYISDINFLNFVNRFDLFIGVDGGVLHYISQYITTLSFYTATNYKVAFPRNGKKKEYSKILGGKYLKCQVNKNTLITKNLHCVGCFQLGCIEKKCGKLLDNDIEIIIKEVL